MEIGTCEYCVADQVICLDCSVKIGETEVCERCNRNEIEIEITTQAGLTWCLDCWGNIQQILGAHVYDELATKYPEIFENKFLQ